MLYKHFKMTYFECTLTCFWKYLWWWGGCELSQLSLTWQGLGEWPKIHWSFGLLSVVLHVQTQAQVRSLFAVGTHLQNLLHKSSFVLSINKKELMKPKIFTLICRERLVNSLYRKFPHWCFAPPKGWVVELGTHTSCPQESGNSVPKHADGRACCPWGLWNTAHEAAEQKLSELTNKMVSRVKYGT